MGHERLHNNEATDRGVRPQRHGAGKYGDQQGLILRVSPSGSKQWIWRGTVRPKRRDLGLGGYPFTSLAEASQIAFEYRKLARGGGDPAALRRNSAAPSFAEARERAIEVRAPSWKDGGKSANNWRSTLGRYAYPRLADMPVSEITSEDVLAVVLPVWQTRRETARKLKGRISAVMAWTIAEGHRADDPTIAVSRALPRNGYQVQHYEALPHSDVAAALATVAASGAWAGTKLAFRFLVLTAARSGDVRGARWDEIDTDAALWTVPAERAKNRRPHRVPLSTAALQVLTAARDLPDSSELIFPSANGQEIPNATMGKLLREYGIDAVPHGFRSSFRDCCGETGVPREVAEACLAHTVADATEAAYARSDLLARRRDTMEAWG